MASLENEYEPEWFLAPGETIEELLELRQVSRAELALSLGISRMQVDNLLIGEEPLTPTIAESLETLFGVPARFWSDYESNYRRKLPNKLAYERIQAQGQK